MSHNIYISLFPDHAIPSTRRTTIPQISSGSYSTHPTLLNINSKYGLFVVFPILCSFRAVHQKGVWFSGSPEGLGSPGGAADCERPQASWLERLLYWRFDALSTILLRNSTMKELALIYLTKVVFFVSLKFKVRSKADCKRWQPTLETSVCLCIVPQTLAKL